MLNAMNDIKAGKVNNIPSQQLYPLLIWFSNHQNNLPVCTKINKYFFYVKPRILLGMLSLGVDKSVRFIKYPKKTKEEEILKLLKPYIKDIYGWSINEWNYNLGLIKSLIQDKTFLVDLNKRIGFEKKECKKLGLEFAKIKVAKMSAVRQKGLFD